VDLVVLDHRAVHVVGVDALAPGERDLVSPPGHVLAGASVLAKESVGRAGPVALDALFVVIQDFFPGVHLYGARDLIVLEKQVSARAAQGPAPRVADLALPHDDILGVPGADAETLGIGDLESFDDHMVAVAQVEHRYDLGFVFGLDHRARARVLAVEDGFFARIGGYRNRRAGCAFHGQGLAGFGVSATPEQNARSWAGVFGGFSQSAERVLARTVSLLVVSRKRNQKRKACRSGGRCMAGR
jgi:hypothetical protein